ncbi:MAG: M48 family metallopeptidase, partial [Cyanobacteria bacterium P01_A01_bin.105]
MVDLTLLRAVFSRQVWRPAACGLLAFFATLSFGLVNPAPSHAGWLDLIFNGIQVLQISNMSDEQEIQLGGQINEQLMASDFAAYNNPQINEFVRSIGERMVPYSDRPNIPYTFQVVNDDSVNAFATMGGYVYVTTGLLAAADSEAEVAGVIGHEIGHIAYKHALQRMKDVAIARGISGALGVGDEQWVGIGVDVALHLPASRGAEYESDEHGFVTMGEAGYAQSGMVTFMQKLVREGGSPPEFLSTHPHADNRVGRLQGMLNSSAISGASSGLDTGAYSSRVAAL